MKEGFSQSDLDPSSVAIVPKGPAKDFEGGSGPCNGDSDGLHCRKANFLDNTRLVVRLGLRTGLLEQVELVIGNPLGVTLAEAKGDVLACDGVLEQPSVAAWVSQVPPVICNPALLQVEARNTSSTTTVVTRHADLCGDSLSVTAELGT